MHTWKGSGNYKPPGVCYINIALSIITVNPFLRYGSMGPVFANKRYQKWNYQRMAISRSAARSVSSRRRAASIGARRRA